MIRLLYRMSLKISLFWRRFWLPYRSRGTLKAILANDPDSSIRRRALQLMGAEVAETVHINPGMRVVFDHPQKAKIIIGERVSIAPNAVLVCESGPGPLLAELCPIVKERFCKQGTITIEDDCWLGAGVILLPGVTLRRGVVIGANSLVIHDCPPFTVWAGSPARMIRKMEHS